MEKVNFFNPKVKRIDGIRHCLISFDIMLDKGSRFFKTVREWFPMEYDLQLGGWFVKVDFVAYARNKFESLRNKEIT